MDRTELLKGIQSYIDTFDELNINDFQHHCADMNFLNPYFGYREGDTTDGLYSRGVQSVWMGGGAGRLSITVNPTGRGRDNILSTGSLTERQLQGVYALVKRLHDKRQSQIRAWKDNPSLQDILPTIGRWAAKWQQAARRSGKPYEIYLTVGRRQCDVERDYHALLVKEGSHITNQIGSIPIGQDRWGQLTYRMQKPLCGEWGHAELLPGRMEQQLQEAVEQLLGMRLEINGSLEEDAGMKRGRGR